MPFLKNYFMFLKNVLVFIIILFPFMSKSQTVFDSQLVKLRTESSKNITINLGGCFTRIYTGDIKFKGLPKFFTKDNSIIKSIYFGKNNSINNTIFLIIGDKNEKEKICIVDANNNHDFSDDYQYIIKKNLNHRDTNIAEPISFNYNYHNQILQRAIYLRPNFYPGSLRFSNPLEQKYFVTFSLAEYKTGDFRFNNQEYSIAAVMATPRAIYDTETVFSVVKAKNTFPSNLRLDYYRSNQRIFIENSIFKISRISPRGDSVYINCEVYDNSKKIGFKIGDYAPNIISKTLEGKIFNLNDYTDKFKLIDFWGTWCVPCIKLIPSIRRIHTKYKNLLVVSIACEDKESQIAISMIKKYKMNWINLYEPFKGKQSIIKAFEVYKFPTTFLIDLNGVILFRGESEDTGNLKKLLHEKFKNN